jgi:D-3-phosphoglycerate dehydrogenase
MGKQLGLSATEIWGKLSPKKRGFDVEVLCYDILENVGDAMPSRFPFAEFKRKVGFEFTSSLDS